MEVLTYVFAVCKAYVNWLVIVLGCSGTEVRINGDRISGLFHLLINGVPPRSSTAKAPESHDAWKTSLSYWKPGNFSGENSLLNFGRVLLGVK